jgi:dienelactone hydrolase
MRRRTLLASVGSATLAAVAGCSSVPGLDSEPAPVVDVAESALRDEPTPPRLTGFASGEEVTLVATTTDSEGVEWRSENVFEANSDGVVDVSAQEPTDGSYDGVDPMGWLWSMTPQTPEADETTAFRSDGDETEIRLAASAGDADSEPDAPVTTTRPHRADGVTETAVDTGDLVGVYFEPAGSGPHPGALALHGSGGSPATNVAELLASHGYATFAPQYFGDHDAIPDSLTNVPLEYFDGAVDWLTSKEAVEDAGVGVWGASRGGELALLLGAHYDWTAAVVSRNGSSVAWNSGVERTTSSWSLDGEPLPCLDGDLSRADTTDDGAYVYREMFVAPYEDADETALEAATIPVEDIDTPTLLIAGADDQLWPSAMLAEHAVDRLREHEVDFEFASERYPDAGHYIIPPYRPTHGMRYGSGGAWLTGGTPAGNAAAAADAWPKVLDCFERGLGSE